MAARRRVRDGLATTSIRRSGRCARAGVEGFWIDERPVTVAEFRRFVKATGHVTVAERPLDPADYPDADPDALVPGSLVFQPPRGPVDLRDWRAWWAYVPGADLAAARRGRPATRTRAAGIR